MAHHHENLVLVDQFLRGQHGLLGVIGRVFNDQLDLAAIQASLLIDFVHSEHHAQANLFAKPGNRTRKILNRSQSNLSRRHALQGH